MAANPKTKNAEKASAGDDQSMEEILQSIRKIIAEENDEPTELISAEDISVPDSDVLELTDAVLDDGSVVNVSDEEPDVMKDIADALQDTPEIVQEEKPAPVAEAPEEDLTPHKPVFPAAAPKVAPVEGEGLVSQVSIAAAAEAMRSLRQSSAGELGSLPFVSGETVEGLVMHLLRPMLKEWLDANLPIIVQQEVQREVKRIAARLED